MPAHAHAHSELFTRRSRLLQGTLLLGVAHPRAVVPAAPLASPDDGLIDARPCSYVAPAPLARERVLATVMFTDIVGSTALADRLGDSRWGKLLADHDAIVRAEVARHRGRVVKSLGDGALTLFDGPSRALGCAVALRDGVRELGLRVRAGLHTGECELLAGEDVGGIAVHIAARIAALAQPDEVLASGTVRDLSLGSPFALQSRGEQELKGIARRWRVYRVEG